MIVLCLVLTFSQYGFAQQKSVNPGINKAFQEPEVSRFAERFEREGREVYDHRHQIIKSAGIEPGITIADVGAGTGLFTRLLAKANGADGTVIAVDIAKEFVDHAVSSAREEGFTNVRGQVCLADSVELPDDSIDLVFVCDTYHHFEFPYKTMRSIWKALKPNGRVVLVEFHREEGKSSDWILGHLRAGQDVFVNEIKQSGFEVASEKDFLETSYFMTFKKSQRTTPEGHTTDSYEAVKENLDNKTAILLDVREEREWKAGHLKSAKLSPLSVMQELELKNKVKELNLPADQIIYTHCRSGVRSVSAAELLKKQGYDARALKAGFEGLLKAGFE